MVYLTIPADFTEEEMALKKKYELLRKFKEKLAMQEPPPNKVDTKRSLEVKPDAKEVAKKLLKSGAISAIKKDSKEKTIFKRPKGSEKKNSDRNSKSSSSYQPFSTSGNSVGSPSNSASSEFSERPVRKLYDSFVSSGKLEDEVKQTSDRYYQHKERNDTTENAQEGNTVYVRGYDLTRELLHKAFRSIGNIARIYIPRENNSFAHVTFTQNEFAYEAIKAVDGTLLDGIKLHVSLARKQFYLPNSSGGLVSSNSSGGLVSSNSSGGLVSSPKINTSERNVREVSQFSS